MAQACKTRHRTKPVTSSVSTLKMPPVVARSRTKSALEKAAIGKVKAPQSAEKPESTSQRRENSRARAMNAAIRLDMARAMRLLGNVSFEESGPDQAGNHIKTAPEMIETIGDIVLARRDLGTSYHLSVVVDDAAQGITEVTRGADLFEATAIHVLLQRLLGLPTPAYHHHRLIRDDHGKRLAKRDDARALAKYRDDGATPLDIRAMVGL